MFALSVRWLDHTSGSTLVIIIQICANVYIVWAVVFFFFGGGDNVSNLFCTILVCAYMLWHCLTLVDIETYDLTNSISTFSYALRVSSGTLLIFHWWKMTGITGSCWGYWERDKCLVLSMNGGDFSLHDTSRIGGCV